MRQMQLAIEEELPSARDVYEHYEEAVSRSLAHLRGEERLEPEALAGAVRAMIESMQRNPDAMLLLDSVRRKSDRQVERALNSSILMVAFGRFLKLAEPRLEALGLAGLFLDVGKNRVPDGVLDKCGMLTPAEYRIVKEHVVHSVELVRGANGRFPEGMDEIILQHHERRDGSGYPRGLEGDQISIEGAIAGIVDSFSALTRPRPFAETRPPSQALNLLHGMSGKCFDGSLVEQFVRCVGDYPVGSPVEMNTGEVGIVIGPNPAAALEPRIMLVLNRDGDELPLPQRILDLSESPETPVGEPYRIRRACTLSALPAGTADGVVSRLCASPGRPSVKMPDPHALR
jgi:HD-GYP domain-containing protein (c-di-GMP phosphodiesterase class II)